MSPIMEQIYQQILYDPRYQRNILYGKPRPGHAEGTIQAHIAELEQNLEELVKLSKVSPSNYWPLKVLIHVHDTFKGEAVQLKKQNCPIEDPQSHASLARAYLSKYVSNETLLNIVQYHDLGYAVYRNYKEKGRLNLERLKKGLDKVDDLDLYLLFCIIDACTVSKLAMNGGNGNEVIRWLIKTVNELYPGKSIITEADVL
jgi:hypothetical protein